MHRREIKYDGLNRLSVGVYGVGHVMNDLCAACWFNYLLYYLVNVQGVSDIGAGAVLLAGQVADAIATPVSGYLSDNLETSYGKRVPIYIVGTITVAFSFFFIWQVCYPCLGWSGSAEAGVRIAWYCLFAAVFNIGWAAVQVAHLSLIPSLTPLKERKEQLIGLRTAFTYVSNITVLLLALLLFHLLSRSTTQFSLLSLIVLGIGLSISLTFVFVIDEPTLTKVAQQQYVRLEELTKKGRMNMRNSLTSSMMSIQAESIEDVLASLDHEEEEVAPVVWRTWLSMPQLYVVGAVYMLSRLASNTISTLLPFYLASVIGLTDGLSSEDDTPWQLALYPMCLYLGSVSTSLLLKRLGESIDRVIQFLVGSGCLLVTLIVLLFLTNSLQYVLVPVLFIMGAGQSLLLNNSFSFIAAFIGIHGKSGAFVWGAMSFLDKISTGVVLFIVTTQGSLDDSTYIESIIVSMPLASCILGSLLTFLIRRTREYTAN